MFPFICENCLQDHINSTIQDRTTKLIICPACGEKNEPPNLKLPVEKWASFFPKDDMIASIKEFLEIIEDSCNTCDWCRNEGNSAQAKIWCVDCKEKLCGICQQSHQKHPAKAFKEHSFVCLDETDALKHTNIGINFRSKCKCHEDKPIETYCMDHKEMCCVVCSSTIHRQCNDIRRINDIATEFGKKTITVLDDAQQIVKNIEEFYNKREETASKVANDISKRVDDINDTCKDLKQQIDKFQSKFFESAEEIRRIAKRKHEKRQNILRRFITNVDTAFQIFKILKQYGTPRQQMESYEGIISRLTTHYRKLKEDLEEESDVHVTAETTDVLKEMTNTVTANVGINMTCTPSESANRFVENMDKILKTITTRLHISPYGGAQIAKKNPWNFQASFIKAVNQQHGGMGGAQCLGGVFLADSHLLLADFHNKRLIECDENYDFVKSYKTNGHVLSVDSAAGFIYMVVWRSGDGDRYICQCQLKDDLKVLNEMPGPRGISGLAIYGDKLVTSSPKEIQILSLSGAVISSIKITGLYSYVAVSRSGTVIHRNNDDVVMTSLQGTQQHRYNHPLLKKPTGVCLDTNDVIYVCGIDSHNLHQISFDGTKGRIFLDKFHGIKEPMGVIYNSDRDEIVITSNREDTVFEVYKLK